MTITTIEAAIEAIERMEKGQRFMLGRISELLGSSLLHNLFEKEIAINTVNENDQQIGGLFNSYLDNTDSRCCYYKISNDLAEKLTTQSFLYGIHLFFINKSVEYMIAGVGDSMNGNEKGLRFYGFYIRRGIQDSVWIPKKYTDWAYSLLNKNSNGFVKEVHNHPFSTDTVDWTLRIGKSLLLHKMGVIPKNNIGKETVAPVASIYDREGINLFHKTRGSYQRYVYENGIYRTYG